VNCPTAAAQISYDTALDGAQEARADSAGRRTSVIAPVREVPKLPWSSWTIRLSCKNVRAGSVSTSPVSRPWHLSRGAGQNEDQTPLRRAAWVACLRLGLPVTCSMPHFLETHISNPGPNCGTLATNKATNNPPSPASFTCDIVSRLRVIDMRFSVLASLFLAGRMRHCLHGQPIQLPTTQRLE